MPVINKTPIPIRIYNFYGLDVQWEGKTQAECSCPFCDSEFQQFRINQESGLFRCARCSVEGNPLTFVRQLYDLLLSNDAGDYDELTTDRKLLSTSSPRKWGIVWNHLTETWMIPGHGADTQLYTLYKYDIPPSATNDPTKVKKRVCLCSPTFSHQLFGVPVLNKKHTTVHICEGPWDGIALWESLRAMGNDATVLAIPSATTFSEKWTNLFSGRTVNLMCQSDHPNPQSGECASYAGMLRVARIMCTASPPPKEINYIQWGPDNHDPSMPHGYDIRDVLTQSVAGKSDSPVTNARTRTVLTTRLLNRLKPLPVEQIGELSQDELDCLPCDNWRDLVTAWRKASKYNNGIDHALAGMLACCTSTELQGDSQLWVMVQGPPSSFKSTLCEALSVNKRYVLAKSNIRGFHSGFQTDAEGKEDNSLVHQMRGKTLVIKDGDTLLRAPNRDQILAEARDVYDGNTRTDYRNKIKRDYELLRSTFILAGTSSLRVLDTSELGQRFLVLIIADRILEDEERDVGWRVVNQAFDEMDNLSNGKLETSDDPARVHAKQLTGGYVGYLRNNVEELVKQVTVTDDAKELCQNLAIFVAHVRARPSTAQDEVAERELSYRLIKQISRLAKCLAVVLNKTTLDNDVMSRVRKVAMDTARGKVLTIVHQLRRSAHHGMDTEHLGLVTGRTGGGDNHLLRFMAKIGICEQFLARLPLKVVQRWRLTDTFTQLYDSVHPTTE